MTSLKERLNNWIKRDGFVPYQDIKDACESGIFGRKYRIGTAERRLRDSESPDIEKVEPRGFVEGYKWRGKIEPKIIYKIKLPDGTVKIV